MHYLKCVVLPAPVDNLLAFKIVGPGQHRLCLKDTEAVRRQGDVEQLCVLYVCVWCVCV